MSSKLNKYTRAQKRALELKTGKKLSDEQFLELSRMTRRILSDSLDSFKNNYGKEDKDGNNIN